jgi:hypothetical protein
MECASLCSFCGMDRRAAPARYCVSFEWHLRAQNRSERTVGNYLESAGLAQGYLEGAGCAESFDQAVADV